MDTKPRDSAYCKWESAFSLLHLSIYGFFWYRVSKNIGKWAKRARTPRNQTCSTRKYVAPLDFKFFRDFSEFFIFHGHSVFPLQFISLSSGAWLYNVLPIPRDHYNVGQISHMCSFDFLVKHLAFIARHKKCCHHEKSGKTNRFSLLRKRPGWCFSGNVHNQANTNLVIGSNLVIVQKSYDETAKLHWRKRQSIVRKTRKIPLDITTATVLESKQVSVYKAKWRKTLWTMLEIQVPLITHLSGMFVQNLYFQSRKLALLLILSTWTIRKQSPSRTPKPNQNLANQGLEWLLLCTCYSLALV